MLTYSNLILFRQSYTSGQAVIEWTFWLTILATLMISLIGIDRALERRMRLTENNYLRCLRASFNSSTSGIIVRTPNSLSLPWLPIDLKRCSSHEAFTSNLFSKEIHSQLFVLENADSNLYSLRASLFSAAGITEIDELSKMAETLPKP